MPLPKGAAMSTQFVYLAAAALFAVRPLATGFSRLDIQTQAELILVRRLRFGLFERGRLNVHFDIPVFHFELLWFVRFTLFTGRVGFGRLGAAATPAATAFAPTAALAAIFVFPAVLLTPKQRL